MLFLQWAYASRQPGMLAEGVGRETRESIHFRFLLIPIVGTLAMAVCFWSAEILLTVYALLLPFYVIPVKPGAAQGREETKIEERKPKIGRIGEERPCSPQP